MSLRSLLMIGTLFCFICMFGCNPRSSVYSRTDYWHSIKTVLGLTEKPAYEIDATQFSCNTNRIIPQRINLDVESKNKIKESRRNEIVRIFKDSLSAVGFIIDSGASAKLNVCIDYANQIGGSITGASQRMVKIRLLIVATDDSGTKVLQGISDGCMQCSDLSWTRKIEKERYSIAIRESVNKVVKQISKIKKPI